MNGETLTPKEWGRRLGAPDGRLVSYRLRYGWPPDRAVTEPVRK